MAENDSAKPRPVVRFLVIPDDGDPYLEGHKCQSCGGLGEIIEQARMIPIPPTVQVTCQECKGVWY